jgi:hypothetical protein
MEAALGTARWALLALLWPASGPAWGAEARTVTFGFENDRERTLPAGFRAAMTGTWKATEWSVTTVDGQHVVAHTGFWNEDPDNVFPLLWATGEKARDLTLSVRLYPVRPPAEVRTAAHDGAGIVVRLKDANNYYLLRAVPHESRVRLYKLVNGERLTLAGKTLPVAVGQWHDLRLRVQGSTFTAYFDGAELFRHEDRTFAQAGSFGLWSKPNNVTYFDDLKAEIAD